jgi:hypothetical protein
MSKFEEAMQLRRVRRAAGRLVEAIMRDEGGFSVETLHCMVALGKAAGLPDDEEVIAVTNWRLKGRDARLWGGAVAKQLGVKGGA